MRKGEKMENELMVREKIDQRTVEDFLFSTGTQLNDQQKKLFFALAIRNQLDPFRREIHAIPYKNNETGKSELSVVTGYEVYLKRAERSGKLNGWKCWTEGNSQKGDLKAIIEIERKDWSKPLRHEVNFSEYDLHRSLWKSKPITMIKKVAIAQGFRLAFPEEIGGMPYTADEIDTQGAIDVTPEPQAQEEKDPEQEQKQITPEQSGLYRDEVIKHLDGYKNIHELRNGYKKHYHEWEQNLVPEDMQKVQAWKDELKKRFKEVK